MVDARPLPSLSSIRAFEAAARLGSFARAGAELGMTGAAVSYHVRQLERQIEVTLFERGAQSVTLTKAGAEVAAETSRFFASLRATFVSAAEAQKGRLSLTALPTLGTSWLTPRLGDFRLRHPEVAVELELSQEPRELGTGRVDAAIRHGDGKWPGLRSVRLFPCVFMPLCPPQSKAAAESVADPKRPPSLPLLGRADWWRRWYDAAGFPRADLEGRFGTTLAAEYLDAAAAMAGHGVTIGSPILFADELAAGRLVPVHDLLAGDGCHFWFVYPVARSRSAKIEAFSEWLRDEVRTAIAKVAELLGPNARGSLLQLQA
jgi:LysR family glycine cleavage system transcriptional activator